MEKGKEGVAVEATRRALVGRMVGGMCLLAVTPVGALAAPPHVEEADETAVQLGYRHDTRNVDAKKYPRHAATQRCVNCAMWQGAAADPWAGCAMFGRKHVAAEGWCTAWAPKPA
ncbi:high-potential iron-sulfur protein [Variovorax sp. PBL-E5]|uniref:high-potential iron-sulfur protein n=1 Tax=Variovorax sp. PBL-E5 TaxID=434014 RepID=UPI001317C363|nr:high-potential iron-sulfur protein [Variovorax sp. PBL-E5]VTU34750.1 High-potential iron-sulfur protein [Variovorax sp. PBL-E5]